MGGYLQIDTRERPAAAENLRISEQTLQPILKKVRVGGTTLPYPSVAATTRAWLPTRPVRSDATHALVRGHTDQPLPTQASTRARAREVLCRERRSNRAQSPGRDSDGGSFLTTVRG
jgi:hypothetical protein